MQEVFNFFVSLTPKQENDFAMKKILGLDLGTNSIGWAVVNLGEGKGEKTTIEAANSRIIPMSADVLGKFGGGVSISQTAERTRKRSIRRLNERHLLRRERLNRVLNLIGFLPNHYVEDLDRYGKILQNREPKLAWKKNEEGKWYFLFKSSFNEMIEDFRRNCKVALAEDKKIPYDWTIYYLRKKALSKEISKQELAWILHNFNQKRGYNQLRGEDREENAKNRVEYKELQVLKVEATDEKKGNDTWYNVYLEQDYIYRRTSSTPLDNWVGKKKEFIITTDLNEDGSEKIDKDGKVKHSFRSPKEDDWTLKKKRTEANIEESGKTVGEYIYDSLLSNPSQKINGRLVQTIERKYYKEELKKILESQKLFHSELSDKDLYKKCVDELYPTNESHRNNIENKDLCYLLLNDILFYQRPLKSKKSLIADCQYEKRKYVNRETGEESFASIKCIAKSNPLFQEFRLWQFIINLRIYKNDGAKDEDVTSKFLKSDEDYVKLFDFLNKEDKIDQKKLLNYKPFGLNKNERQNYRWNYVEDKSYPCNETRYEIEKCLKRTSVSYEQIKDNEYALWHILYSIDDRGELEKALKKFAEKNGLPKEFVEELKKCKPFAKDYGSYSEKAIKKLLPLMRMGDKWKKENIDQYTLTRIDKILTGEYDNEVNVRLREKLQEKRNLEDFKGLPLWLACYVVYGRHSEAQEICKWEKPEDIDVFLNGFKQHSLRNPIVEQVVLETLRTVRDIWKTYGTIDEIHIELGREMKKTAEERKSETKRIAENEETNHRIKCLLAEFMNPEFEVENVRSYSPSQWETLKIYENTSWSSADEVPEDILKIKKKFTETKKENQPSKSDVVRYKVWLEQNCRSPYTGQTIPLGKLFTSEYEIEHIIPQAVYFDDSLSNKVICESEVNKLKSNQLGYVFIKEHHGEKVRLSNGKVVEIYSVEEYEQNIENTFGKSSSPSAKAKKRKLLMDEIPDDFIARQLNDSRYISKLIKGLLSNMVREEGEQEAISKNVITCTGGVTDRLKKDWGVNDVWNRIILPRFKRLNDMTASNNFVAKNREGHEIPAMPLELQKGFNPKRIDHRHHAMDAIVIALASLNIVNYLNNESASTGAEIKREDLKRLLCDKTKLDASGNYKWVIKRPYDNFAADVFNVLNNSIVSFKQKLRIMNKTNNKYIHYNKETGKKEQTAQTKGNNFAIRKSLHKDTVFGEVNLRFTKEVAWEEAIKTSRNIVDKELKKKIFFLEKEGKDLKEIIKYFEENKDAWGDVVGKKVKVYYFSKDTKDRYFAVRTPLDTSFNEKTINKSVADSGIRKILLKHLENCGGKAEIAFSPEGVEEMNQNIRGLNNGKPHQPIRNVRKYERANKFPIGEIGNKSKKFVEGAKGTNLFFAVYESVQEDETGKEIKKRSYQTISLN